MKISNSGELFFGEDAFVSSNTDFVCVKKISIGAFCKISWNCTFLDCDFHKIIDMESGKVTNEPRDIIISDKVWIGCNSTILKGTSLPEQCILAAGSIIGKSLNESNCVYKNENIIKRGVCWKD